MLSEVLCLYCMKIAVKLVQENRPCRTSGKERMVLLLFLEKFPCQTSRTKGIEQLSGSELF